MERSTKNPELEFLFDQGSLAPFDRSLATISLRSNANSPVDGYPVYVSATFGSQVVKLFAGTTEFDVVFEIHEAEILVDTKNTTLEFGDGYHQHSEVLSQPRQSETSTSARKSSSRELRDRSLSAGSNRETEARGASSFQDFDKNYEHPRLELIKIGSRKSPEPLSGTVVRNYFGWSALPESNFELSGVRAELNVREPWVSFRDPKTESETVLGRLSRKLLSSDKRQHKEKKLLFADLLKQLSLRGIQRASNDSIATLDVCGILCIPNSESPKIAITDLGNQGVLEANEALLIEFLQSPEGQEQAVLNTILERQSAGKPKKSFVPSSGVMNARTAYLEIAKMTNSTNVCDRAAAISEFGRNEIKDLSSAGLIVRNGQSIQAVNPFPTKDLKSSFKALICRFDTINFVRDLLQKDPRMNTTQIGERVAVYLSRDWEESSCQKNGHHLRTWTTFAYRDMLVTEKGEPLDRVAKNFKEGVRKRGSAGFLSDENRLEISKLKREGKNVSQIARHIGAKPASLHNFKRNHPNEWAKL